MNVQLIHRDRVLAPHRELDSAVRPTGHLPRDRLGTSVIDLAQSEQECEVLDLREKHRVPRWARLGPYGLPSGSLRCVTVAIGFGTTAAAGLTSLAATDLGRAEGQNGLNDHFRLDAAPHACAREGDIGKAPAVSAPGPSPVDRSPPYGWARTE
jgi:hypothetical protein